MSANETNQDAHGVPSDLLLGLRAAKGRGMRVRLEHALRAAIQARRLVAGVRLPPTRELAADLGVSRGVVVAAYANLIADGYLEAQQGAGTRVRAGAQPRSRQPPLEQPRYDPEVDFPDARRLRDGSPSVRMFGGLPDPALFPRAQWMRHYRAALAELPDRELTYPRPLGATALRDALVAYLGRVRGVVTARDQLLVCSGITQGLTLVCRALRRSGVRRVAVEDPCFGPHRAAIAMTGLEPVPIAVDSGGLDVSQLVTADVGAVLVVPAHSYPTGSALDGPRRRELIRWACERGRLVLEDDYDAEFRYGRAPIGALQGHGPDNVVYLGSASKTFTPALRLGWVAAPASLIDALEREKRVDDLGSSLIDQLAFARFLDSGDFSRYLRRVHPIYRARRDAALEALTQLLPEGRCTGTHAGLHLHVTLPQDVDELALSRAAYEHGVLLERAAAHWANPDNAPPSIVVGYGAFPETTMRRIIGVLATALAASRVRADHPQGAR
jgi:GntR family transcriptional regulator / MocR family aminotransferase